MSHSSSADRQRPTLISRRRLLQAGGLGALTLGLPGMVAVRMDGNQGLRGVAAEKSCIFLLLCGGPSHLDTWDLKPAAPEGIRGPYKPIATKVPGMHLCELHPRLARLTQHFSLIRSMTHVGNISNHFDAMHHLLSGQAGAPADAPYLGSVLAKVRPSQRNVASYVWLIKCVGDPVFCAPNIGTGGHLGAVHGPLFVGSASNHPAMRGFKAPDLFASTEPERMQGRRRLLDRLSPTESASAGQRVTNEWQDLHRKAFRLGDQFGRTPGVRSGTRAADSARPLRAASPGAKPAPGAPARRGRGRLRHRQRLDRPLADGRRWSAGSSWDMHGGHMGMGNAFGDGSYGMGWCLPRLDEALSALLVDLTDRGLLERTLVVVVGEFGRSPRINTTGAPGRLHWPNCYSAILAGAGIRGGTVHGESDKIGAYVKDKPVRPQDLGATIYHALDVPLDLRLGKDGVSRPITTGQPIMKLFG